jgi:uncharacterized phosphosugar-binding protein
MKPVFETFQAMLQQAADSQGEAITAAGELVAHCLAGDGLVHLFGTGHSHMLAEELFYRAGGLINVNPILDTGLMLHESALASTDLERLEGYAAIVLNRYTFSPPDVMIVISNSGRNAGPVEAALEARRRGLPVIALTALAYSQASRSRHSSGKRLFELADVVLDNGGVAGDAAVAVPGLTGLICPTSTIIGATLLHAVVFEAVTRLLAQGIQPAIVHSANVDSDQDSRHRLIALRKRVRHL